MDFSVRGPVEHSIAQNALCLLQVVGTVLIERQGQKRTQRQPKILRTVTENEVMAPLWITQG